MWNIFCKTEILISTLEDVPLASILLQLTCGPLHNISDCYVITKQNIFVIYIEHRFKMKNKNNCIDPLLHSEISDPSLKCGESRSESEYLCQ
jgi:hypothetical protein